MNSSIHVRAQHNSIVDLRVYLLDVYLASTGIFLEYKNWQNLQELEKTWLSKCRDIFESRFREARFVNSLSNAIDCYSKLALTTGIAQ